MNKNNRQEWIQAMRHEINGLSPGETIQCEKCPESLDLNIALFFGQTIHFADEILDGIEGAAYEFYWTDRDCYGNPMCGQVFFHRLSAPYPSGIGIFTYISPDRRHLMEGVSGRLRIKGKDTSINQSRVPVVDRVYYFLEDVRKDFRGITYPGDRILLNVIPEKPVMLLDCRPIPRDIPFTLQMYELKAYSSVLQDRRSEMDLFKFVECSLGDQ